MGGKHWFKNKHRWPFLSVSFPIWFGAFKGQNSSLYFSYHSTALLREYSEPSTCCRGFNLGILLDRQFLEKGIYVRVYVYDIPVTQMTLVLIWRGFPFGGFNPQNKGKNRFQVYIKIQICLCTTWSCQAQNSLESQPSWKMLFYLKSGPSKHGRSLDVLAEIYFRPLPHLGSCVVFFYFGTGFLYQIWGALRFKVWELGLIFSPPNFATKKPASDADEVWQSPVNWWNQSHKLPRPKEIRLAAQKGQRGKRLAKKMLIQWKTEQEIFLEMCCWKLGLHLL